MASSGQVINEMCEFPFTYMGITYNECTWDWPPILSSIDGINFDLKDILEDEGYTDAGAWCMFRYWKNENTTGIGRGKCGRNCPIPPKPEGILK